MTEKECIRVIGKDDVYLVEGEDYIVDIEKSAITITDKGQAKCPTDIRVPYCNGEER